MTMLKKFMERYPLLSKPVLVIQLVKQIVVPRLWYLIMICQHRLCSVEAPKLSIQEGEIAEFKVVLEGSQNGDFYLIYSVVASHDGLINGLIGGHGYTYSELFSSSSGSLDPLIYAAKAIQGRIEKSYFYQSVNDEVYQQNSEITFTILQQNESTYNVSTATCDD